MKLALIFFSVLTSLSISFTPQGTPPVVCRGKPLPITLLPGPKMTGPSLPLRFGGTRPVPSPWVNMYPSEKGFRQVIKTRYEFSDFWKGLARPGQWLPPLPEIDFTKEMIVVSAMGQRPTGGYLIVIDGACEMDNQIEVFIDSVESVKCIGVTDSLTYPADAVRLPRSDLPVVFRETQIPCKEWAKRTHYQD